jgi:hypothetical protein
VTAIWASALDAFDKRFRTFKKYRAMINADAALALQNRPRAVQFERFRTEKICSRQQDRYAADYLEANA